MNTLASSKVRDLLKKCNLLEYYDRFLAEGFDQIESLLDVTESDLIAMDVKRGHRRRLQREIATIKGVPVNVPLPLCVQHGSGLEDSSDGQTHPTNNIIPSPTLNLNAAKILYVNGHSSSSCSTVKSSHSSTSGDPPDPPDKGNTKRKYKRHPKRDKNAPVKPLSAYVMFAHRVREELAGQNISFPDMAKIVGDRWKNVSPELKEQIENEASKKKEEYQNAMAVYKTTDGYKKYQEYLKEFKEKYESNSRESSKRKRQKIEPSPDSSSGYSSARSGFENASGNTSSESSNGNGHGNGGHHVKLHQIPTGPFGSPHSTNYIPPPYPHSNPIVPYGYTSNSGQIIGTTSFVTPPPSVNTSNSQSTTLADLYAKDDSNVGDDQSQLGNTSSSGNGSGNGSSGCRDSSSSRSVEREDSSDNSSNNTPSTVSDDNQDQRFQNQKSR